MKIKRVENEDVQMKRSTETQLKLASRLWSQPCSQNILYLLCVTNYRNNKSNNDR